MDKRKRITVTFGEYDDDVYNFLQDQKNASALIRHLVRLYIKNVPIEPISNYNMVKNEVLATIEHEKPNMKSAELDLEKARKMAVDFEL